MKKILKCFMSENIGQVNIEKAQAEVERLNAQENTTLWHLDFSDELYCYDETDLSIPNPCPLFKGYAWVTKSTRVSNSI